MKQIFDWLREQFKDKSEVCYRSYLKLRSDEDYGCSFAYSHAVDLINEAEAKWEQDCCIWKKNIYFFGGHDYSSGCGTRIPLNSLEYHKYCPFCGKPIKISEVE